MDKEGVLCESRLKLQLKSVFPTHFFIIYFSIINWISVIVYINKKTFLVMRLKITIQSETMCSNNDQENTQWQRTSKLKFYDRCSFYLRPRRGQLNNPTHQSSIVLSFIVTFKVHILFTSILPINKWLGLFDSCFQKLFFIIENKKTQKTCLMKWVFFCLLCFLCSQKSFFWEQ